MEPYRRNLKPPARDLRKRMTEAEIRLWSKLRRKQICDVPFYRQKPLGPYIVDFYCAKARLVVEVDGGQHFEAGHQAQDAERDRTLRALGSDVLRFSNREVLQETDAVLKRIDGVVRERLRRFEDES